jgi:tetratricopeptide (TPR) repeat protein
LRCAFFVALPATETDRLASLSPELRRARTFATLRQLLLPSAEKHPLVLAVENLHWIDPTSEAFLAALIEGMAGVRCLVLTTYRLGYRPSWIERSYVTQMVLHPLSAQDSRALLRAIFPAASMADPLGQLILTRAQGNPFFLEELVQGLAGQGMGEPADASEGTGWSPCPPMLQISATVQEVLVARLDHLPPAALSLLQTLAVLGRSVPWRLLTQVVGQPEASLSQALETLQVAEFLYEQPVGLERAYRFKHVLTQEVAYTSLPREQRQQLHACTAQALEALYADRLEEHYEMLAHHYCQSGNAAQAVAFLQRAGEQALQRSAYVEAVQHFTTGADLLTTLPHTLEHARHELDLLIPLAEAVRIAQGETSLDYERFCVRAHALCQQLGDTPQLFEVLIGLRKYYEVRGQCQRARELAEQAFTLTAPLQDPARLAEAHYSLGLTLYYLGEIPAARAHFEQRIALYEQRQRGSMVHCLSYVSYILWVLGYPDQALQRTHEALTVAQAWSYPFSVYLAIYHAGHTHRLRREVHAAHECNEAAMALASELGLARWLPMTVHQRGWVLAAQGQSAEGIAQMREGLSALQATEAELAQPRLLALLAEAYGHEGQAEAGLRVMAEALAVAQRTGERRDEAEIFRIKGELLLRQAIPNAPEAEACFQQALAIARRQQAKSWELRAAMSLARLWQQQGKLLTAIETKRVRRVGAVREQAVDVKVVAATQAELSVRVAAGQFRADLYHRLAVIVLVLPPLRDRGADLVCLAQQFLQQYAEAHRLPPKRLSRAAAAWLQRYDWPGNVRELSHLMERVTLLSPEARLDSQTLERLCLPRVPAVTPAVVVPAEAEDQPLDEAIRITHALRQTQGNVVQAARVLGLSRKALRYRMQRYGLERPRQAGQGEETVGRQDTGNARILASAWEQKPVAVLAIETTWPAAVESDPRRYEPWTAHARWEHTVLEKVQGFGGVVLQRGPSLLLVAFGLPHTLEQLPHRAVQTAFGIRQLTAKGSVAGEREPRPTVRQAVHWGQVLVEGGASGPTPRGLLPSRRRWRSRCAGSDRLSQGRFSCLRQEDASSRAGSRCRRVRSQWGIDMATGPERTACSASDLSGRRWRCTASGR